jgi:signal transduction histidine kinase
MFKRDTLLWAVISLNAIFIIDIVTPIGIAVDVLYICCILIVYRQGKRTILTVGIAAIALILINAIIFETVSKINYITLINHGISAVAVLITTYLANHYQQMNEKIVTKEQQHIAELKEMLFITSHKIRRPVANILGLLQLDDPALLKMPPEELNTLLVYLNYSMEEVDNNVKELNKYIESVNRNAEFTCQESNDAVFANRPIN